jgi:ribosomal protein S18 acetylase RimI-like enzyme
VKYAGYRAPATRKNRSVVYHPSLTCSQEKIDATRSGGETRCLPLQDRCSRDMNEDLSLRAYRADDFTAVVGLWSDCGLLRPWNDPQQDIDRCLANPSSTILVGAHPRREGLGASVMLGSDGHRGWLYYLAVAPDLRRQGFGRRAVRAAENWLAERGVGKVMLMLRPDNEAVIDFYRSLDYKIEERVLMAHWL